MQGLDWKEMGEQSFVMEILDELKPCGERGYH